MATAKQRKQPTIQEVAFCDAERHAKMLVPDLLYRYVIVEGCEACRIAAEKGRENRTAVFMHGFINGDIP